MKSNENRHENRSKSSGDILFVFFDLILYVPSTIFPLNRGGSSWVEHVLS